MEEKRICPECGKEYSSRPALSRKDNKTMICPKCGMMEAELFVKMVKRLAKGFGFKLRDRIKFEDPETGKKYV